jgi:hypothetical protein
MTGERTIQAHLDRERARREAAAGKPEDAATPQQKLVRAAETGRFEAIVAAAQPAEPPKMVTPEEREAELRRAGKGPDKPKAKRKPAPKPEPKEPKRPPTPNEAYVDEHCQWRARGPNDYRETHRVGRSKTEYDPLSGEVEGDGYADYDEEGDAW